MSLLLKIEIKVAMCPIRIFRGIDSKAESTNYLALQRIYGFNLYIAGGVAKEGITHFIQW